MPSDLEARRLLDSEVSLSVFYLPSQRVSVHILTVTFSLLMTLHGIQGMPSLEGMLKVSTLRPTRRDAHCLGERCTK